MGCKSLFSLPSLSTSILNTNVRLMTGQPHYKQVSGWMLQLSALVLTCLWFTDSTAAIEQPIKISYHIPHVESAPKIDGTISDGEWDGAERVHLSNETFPSQNIPALADTEVLLMEDGANFYLAFIAHDPEPDKIRAFYRDRDSSWDDDFVGVVIDTFNDERRAFEFFANPLGVQTDATLDDVVGNEDDSWNAIWDSAGKINKQGYTVEMMIPLNQLRFTAGLDKQIWGINLIRNYPRDKRHTFSSNTKDYSLTCYLCQLKKAEGFSNLREHVNLQLVPTVTASYSADRPSPATDDHWQHDFNPQFGMDVRWGINQDFYLNATYNPDFSQVEADVAQLDVNNTYSLYYPERRDFFLDGADYFNTMTNLVHTRNIAAPDFGVKVTGKRNGNTYGLFFANDTNTSFIIPGNEGSLLASLDNTKSLNTVLRYRRDINRNTNIGIIATDRRAGDYYNTVAGIDGNMRIGNSDQIAVQVLKSFSKYPGSIQSGYSQKEKIHDSAYLFRYHHDDDHWFWTGRFTQYGDDFRADMGFINRVDYRQVLLQLGRKWRFGSDRRFNYLQIGSNYVKTWDAAGNNLGQEFLIFMNAQGPWQSFLHFNYNKRKHFYNGRFFNEYVVNFFGNIQPRAGMIFGLNINTGDRIDFANTRPGWIFTVNPDVNMQIGKHLQLRLQYHYQRLDVDGGNLYYTNLADFRTTYQFGIRSFLRAIIQYSDTRQNPALYTFAVDKKTKTLAAQLLYSYKINPQTRFYIGCSTSGFRNDELGTLKSTNYTVFSKFSYAWQY